MLKLEGAQSFRLKAKIAGGAQMFQFTSDIDSMRIGPRNVEAVKNELKKRGFRSLQKIQVVIVVERLSLILRLVC